MRAFRGAAACCAARVYTPAETNGPPALLVPGVHAGGIDEPRLIEFARDVASMGRIVVTAELPDLKRYSITPRTTDMIEDAALWLVDERGFAQDGRIGMMGISFAGGLSIVAAGRAVASRSRRLRDVVRRAWRPAAHAALSLHRAQPDGASRPPHDYGVAIILLGVAERVVPAEQAAAAATTRSWPSCTRRTSTWWTSRRRRSSSRARRRWPRRCPNRRGR